MQQPTICFVAGRSGGHIIPCLTRSRELIKRYPAYQILFFSTHVPLDMKIITNSAFVTQHVPLTIDNFPYKRFLRYPLFCWQFLRSFFTSWYWLKKMAPKQVITTGGYVALPVCLAAKLLKIPVELQLLDVIPGKALKVLSPLAQSISICFEQSKKYLPQNKCMLVNYPIRFNKEDKQISKEYARDLLNLDREKYLIFILGGSQGSLFLNNLFKQWLASFPHMHQSIQVIHQTGSHENDAWKKIYADYGITAFVFDYYHELQHCYRAADLVMCRSGAGTLFEVRFFDLFCITIPLEADTTSHQKNNALAFEHCYPHKIKVLFQNDIEKNKNELQNLVNSLIFNGKLY